VSDDKPNIERNRAIALKVNESLGQVDDETYLAYYNEHPTWHVNRTAHEGRDALRRLNLVSRTVFPHGIEREIHSVVAEGDRVMIQHANRAITAAGRDYENEYVKIFRFDREGKICEVWEYLDSRYAAEVLSPDLDA